MNICLQIPVLLPYVDIFPRAKEPGVNDILLEWVPRHTLSFGGDMECGSCAKPLCGRGYHSLPIVVVVIVWLRTG